MRADRASNMAFDRGRPEDFLVRSGRLGYFTLSISRPPSHQRRHGRCRSQDLGVVQHACIILLAKYGEEQYKRLMTFSQNVLLTVVVTLPASGAKVYLALS
jgi:hypothetical protein